MNQKLIITDNFYSNELSLENDIMISRIIDSLEKIIKIQTKTICLLEKKIEDQQNKINILKIS